MISGFYQNNGTTDGFVDSGGTITTLAGPAGAASAMAFGLNNAGQVVGSYVDAAGATHGFVYGIAAGSYTTIDDPNAAAPAGTVVNGINDFGQLASA